jgi:pathogenesis-related protein 1
MPAGDLETGRVVGITAAQNAVRAMVQAPVALPPLTWSATLAQYAQEWADNLATTSCNSPHHRTNQELQQKGYGENIYYFYSTCSSSTAQQAVDSWASEIACWTYGGIGTTDMCDAMCIMQLNATGCGHYTQLVWRDTTEVGCGVASCQEGAYMTDLWVCNYSPSGNWFGRTPY